jgi:signal transduction histidine kinase
MICIVHKMNDIPSRASCGCPLEVSDWNSADSNWRDFCWRSIIKESSSVDGDCETTVVVDRIGGSVPLLYLLPGGVLALTALWGYHRHRLRQVRRERDEAARLELRGARHDLLSPLNAISGYLELLSEESSGFTEVQRGYLTKARAAFQRALQLLDTLK